MTRISLVIVSFVVFINRLGFIMVVDFINAKYNSDDGWDLYSQPYQVTMNHCEASYNGYINSSYQTTSDGDGNGFKLGSKYANVSHRVLYCTAKGNLKYGIDANGNTAKQTITGCTVTNNKEGQISSRTKY